MKESQIWRHINLIQKKHREWHFVRIESNTINGIPDINACMDGVEFWLELKSNDAKNYGLSKYQMAWCLKRQAAGGKSFILHNSLLKREFKILEIREPGLPFPVSRFPYRAPSTVLLPVLTALQRLASGEKLTGSNL